MRTPVFVIHGIGNRDESAFVRTVDALANTVGGITAWPIYWGDLGARYELISHTVPGAPVSPTEVRGADVASARETEALARFFSSAAERDGEETRSSSAVPTLVLDAAIEALTGETGDLEEVREGTDQADVDDVRLALAEQWASTTWLHRLDDDQLLRAVGTAVGRAMADEAIASSDEGFEVRGAEVRAIDIGGFVSRRLQDLDRVVGAAFGAAGSRLNTHLRTSFLPGITQAVGDILVYQRHREVIGDRVRKVIDDIDDRLGRSPEHPVDILAHSLGGVIAFDLATSEDPLWIRRLVTFGSQPSFFHVSDPRSDALDPYTGTPVQLPKSIGAWTNLWEPLDPLAFVAARIFRLHDGSLPEDNKVSHLASSGLWTHSDYWGLAEVAQAIGNALA
jgi:hypothetical protein